MSDLTDDALPEWTPEELALLRSADEDRPPSRSLPATLAAIGAGSAIASGAAGAQAAAAGMAGATAKWSSVVALSKWIAIATVGAVAVAGGVALSKRSEAAEHSATSAAHVAAPAPKAAAPASIAAPADSPSTLSGLEAGETSQGRSAITAPAARASAVKRAAPSQPDIRLELAALDAALAQLKRGNATEALAALDRYDADFAKTGSLRVEATALRIEALLRAGSRAKADAIARAFLSSDPQSPYAVRIRALLAGPLGVAPEGVARDL